MGADHPKFISVKEFAAKHGLGENTVKRRCQDKTMPCVKYGKRVLIPEDALTIMMGEQGWVRS